MRYLVVDYTSSPAKDATLWLTDGPANAEKAFRAAAGRETASAWPEVAVFAAGVVEGSAPLDVVPCAQRLLVLSSRAAEALVDALGGLPCELLPARIARPRAQGGPLDVRVTNPLGTFDALQPTASGAEYDEDGDLEDFERLVLDRARILLAVDGASERVDFVEVVERVCVTKSTRLGWMSYGEDELLALLERPSVRARDDNDHLAAVAREHFPYLN